MGLFLVKEQKFFEYNFQTVILAMTFNVKSRLYFLPSLSRSENHKKNYTKVWKVYFRNENIILGLCDWSS